MDVPTDKDIIEIAVPEAIAMGIPEEFANVGGAMAMAMARAIESDCNCDACVTIRGIVQGLESVYGHQDT
jgi:hypothetical protein